MKNLKKIATATILCSTLLVSAGGQTTFAAKDQSSSKVTVANTYTGEELFKGILFGQGKVAEKFPEIWTPENLKDAKKKDAREFADKLVNEIKKEDPTFFGHYQKAIYSNNPAEIDLAFTEASKLIKTSSERLGINFDIDPATGQCVAVAGLAVAVAGYMYLAGAHTVVGVVQLITKVAYWDWSKAPSSTLEKEMFIQDVVTNI